MRLQDKVAIVTGSGRGLGQAYAATFAREGAKVVIADINEAAAQATAEDIRSAGGRSLAMKVDVSNRQDTMVMAEAALSEFGSIDILVNNAALFADLGQKPFTEISQEEWDKVMRIQLDGMLLCCQAVIPQMKRQGKGKIINVSSGTVLIGKPNYLHYVTSKAAVIGFTRALAREVGQFGINVNTICPGAVDTGIPRSTIDDKRWEIVVNTQCFKRRGTPKDLAGPALFLALPESDWITGQMINVDAGLNLY